MKTLQNICHRLGVGSGGAAFLWLALLVYWFIFKILQFVSNRVELQRHLIESRD